ncbi:MAG TPA: ribosome maturation factor RimM [Hyphomonas sp.]|nr:16S rRNA processing protein RimM [Hyphomonas sp.]MCA8905210.1 16S rRNA processing protein RimM [Hyphomonas sp.]MCB9970860.1 16S rRNA processing protein RimM [Hyphomonas sp.]HPE46966.1 ribosome maturation factor RimM [Hyphomonas sp.]
MIAGDPNRLIVVGVLKGAHGVRGEVRVKSLTADPEAMFGYGPLLDAAGNAVLTPMSARPGKDHFIVRPREQKQKEDWDGLRGTLLHVPRTMLPAVDEDEFYIDDLVGLEVFAGGMVPAGKVRAVHDFGAGDLLEITLTSGGSVMVPFTEADVPVVDLAAGRLVIASLDDWLGGDDTAETPE